MNREDLLEDLLEESKKNAHLIGETVIQANSIMVAREALEYALGILSVPRHPDREEAVLEVKKALAQMDEYDRQIDGISGRHHHFITQMPSLTITLRPKDGQDLGEFLMGRGEPLRTQFIESQEVPGRLEETESPGDRQSPDESPQQGE